MNQIGSNQDRIGKSYNKNFNSLLVELLERDSERRLNWDDYFKHPFFTERQYKGYYELLNQLSSTTYYSIYKVKEIKTQLEKVMKIINKDKIRKKNEEEHLVPIDEKILDNLVNYSIMQTEMMKLLENVGLNENTVKILNILIQKKNLL